MISNIDSYFFSLDIEEYDNNNQDLIQNLELAKNEAKENKLEEHTIELASKKFIILPNGARFHAFILHNDSMELKFAQGRSKSESNYPVAVRIKSLKLWEKGFEAAYDETIETIKQIVKGDIIAEKISRADMCCHTDTLGDININDWRGTFRKLELHYFNRNINGLTFGTFEDKNTMCRVYDKSLEIKSSNKLWFRSIWIKAGLDPDKVWNVEYQIGRTYFKERNIETTYDFIIQMRGIWENLTTQFVSYIDRIDTNISRCPLKTCWTDIHNAFNKYYKQYPIKRVKQLNKRAEALIPLFVGVMTSYGACKNNITVDQVLDEFKEDLKIYLKEKKDNIPIEQIILDKIDFMYS
jgi:hypothetical protein